MNGLIESLVKSLTEVRDAYYAGEPIMPDSAFDSLEDDLRQVDPNNPYFDTVGVVATKEKVKHNIPMLSCDKVKNVEGIFDWIKKMNLEGEELVIEPKIDGVSCSIIYEYGVIKRVATRGDGLVGQDITHISNFVNIPPKIDFKNQIEVRGELYLPKNTKFPNPDNKPLRSMVGGLLNRKDSGLENLRFVRFISYQIYGSSLVIEDNKLTFLEGIGFSTVPYRIANCYNHIETFYNNYISVFRDEWEFETDGLVFVVSNSNLWDDLDAKYVATNHHYYNIALKPPPISKETILEGIEWNVSRFGKIIPTALLMPVVIGGSKITRCTLSNAENVEKLNLAFGDTIVIERSNDVIPYFKENKSKHPIQTSMLPIMCPSCKSELFREGPHLICTYGSCREKIIMEILHWVQKCEMDGLSESFVRKLVDAKRIMSVTDLYKLKAKDFDEIEGFGDRKIQIALEQIEKSKTMSVHQFLERLGINGVGRRAIEKLGINTVNEIFLFKSDGSFIGNNLQRFVELDEPYISRLLTVVKVYDQDVKENKQSLGNVCMTGSGPKTRNELIDELSKMGYSFVGSVSKDTDILVCKDVSDNSDKLKKARKLGVKIISYEEFFGKEKI